MTTSAEPPPKRRRGRPGHDQQAVLRQAIELFNRRGYDATSIDDLAKELKVTKSAVYHHVPSKEYLLSAALDQALDGLTQLVDQAQAEAGTSSAYDRLHATLHRSVHILIENLAAVTLLLRVRGNSDVERQALARRRHVDEAFAALVAEAIAEGSLRDDLDPGLVARLLFGLVNSLTEWYDPHGATTADQIADALTTLTLQGLHRPPEPH